MNKKNDEKNGLNQYIITVYEFVISFNVTEPFNNMSMNYFSYFHIIKKINWNKYTTCLLRKLSYNLNSSTTVLKLKIIYLQVNSILKNKGEISTDLEREKIFLLQEKSWIRQIRCLCLTSNKIVIADKVTIH